MKEKHGFQAEIMQLLDIVINSLYTEKEIFLRELISNASDACERVRFQQSSGASFREPDLPLSIRVKADEKENTLTISDTGCGMTRSELTTNLGIVAHSGSKTFLSTLEVTGKPDLSLIGQFGVGFYSAFTVASQVVVHTQSADPDE